MLVIGLTGGISSGKTTVANLFAEKGIIVIDADLIAREVTAPGEKTVEAIVNQFGKEVLSEDHILNRAKLREIIFKDEKKRLWLEKLLHPIIRKKIYEQVLTAKSPYCITVIPLLLETKSYSYINRILVVDTTEDEQLKRTTIRDKITTEQAKAILKTQVNREKRLAAADDVIVNTGHLSEVEAQVNKLHHYYLELANAMS